MKTCKIDGCERKHCALGLCSMHYKRLLKHGDPLYQRKFAKNMKHKEPTRLQRNGNFAAFAKQNAQFSLP